MRKLKRMYLNLSVGAAVLFIGSACSVLHSQEKLPAPDIAAQTRAGKSLPEKEKAGSENYPQLVVKTGSYDAGEIWSGKKLSHTFVLENKGEVNLEIKRIAPC